MSSSFSMKQSESESQNTNREPFNTDSLLQRLSIKTLRSAESVLDDDLMHLLHKKYKQTLQQDKTGLQFIEHLIYSMFNYIDRLQQAFEVDIVREDYNVLEEAVQKSEAEVRKHIRIEQQLKIYLDTLEDKVEDMEKKAAVEEMKYAQLFQSMKEIDQERKTLQGQLVKMEEVRETKETKAGRLDEIKDKSRGNSNHGTINDQLYKDYFGGRKVKVNKGRHVIDKATEKNRKLSTNNQKSGNNLQFAQGSIQINLSNNIVVNKKGSYDQNLNRNKESSHNSSIRELTKTVSMKQPSVYGGDRRPNRKVSKYRTEGGEPSHEKKEGRSNSVCN